MSRFTVPFLILLFGVTLIAAAPAIPVQETDPESQTAMEAMARYAQPGQHHGHLKALAGDWKVSLEFRMSPEAPATQLEGEIHARMVLGGRFLRQDYRGVFMGHTFEGTGFLGFNNVTQKYEGVWVDTMSTGIYHSEGACNGIGTRFEFRAQNPDPMTGKMRVTREILRIEDANHYVTEIYEPGPDGREFKSMTMRATRRTRAPRSQEP